jgi:hypothetical protein
MSFVSCNQFNTAVAAKQDKLLDCAGAPLAGNVPTCTQMATAIAAATPAATTATAGVITLATPLETVEGKVTDKAVTPEDMAYALQGAVESYPIYVRSKGETLNPLPGEDRGLAVLGRFEGVAAAQSPAQVQGIGVCGYVDPKADTPADKWSAGVSGFNISRGAGNKIGMYGFSMEAGGAVNYGVFGSAGNAAVNWAGFFNGNVNVVGTVSQGSDARVKQNVATIDAVKALAFRNGLRWVTYKKVIPVMGQSGIVSLDTGYEAGLIAQEVQALTEEIGAFQFVVKTQNPDMLGLDYNSINAIVMAAEQALLGQP